MRTMRQGRVKFRARDVGKMVLRAARRLGLRRKHFRSLRWKTALPGQISSDTVLVKRLNCEKVLCWGNTILSVECCF